MRQKSMHRCPYCFAALPSGLAFRTCAVGTLEDGSQCSHAVATPVQLGTQQDFDTKFCAEHGTKLVDSCYAVGCQKTLPDRWHEVTTTTIAMAGTRSSGKTVFVAVAANLLRGWGRRQGMSVDHYDAASKLSFERVYGRLDDGSRLYGSTEPEIPGQVVRHQEPVLLRLQRPGHPDHVLVLRDVAGENLQDAVMDTTHFRFLADADGLILMVDPSESAEIQQDLVGVIPLPAANFNPDAVWGNLERLQNAVKGPQADMVPFAVTLSKFDIVRRASEQPNSRFAQVLSARGSRLFHDPSLRSAGFDRSDGDLLGLELRTLHRHLGMGALNRWADSYSARSEVRFFAVSSLGQPPVSGRVSGHGLIPYRCLDPIKWFLAEAGVVGSI